VSKITNYRTVNYHGEMHRIALSVDIKAWCIANSAPASPA